jgi:GT2 family glycosyltransferase
VIGDCLRSVFNQTTRIAFEVIVSDNGSSDRSLDYIRKHFANVRIVENGQNLGFAKGNNAGINVANGEYVLILNPDTIIRERALEKLVSFADNRPEAGAFGCRVLNPDGSFQNPARPIPTVSGYLISALYLRWLGRLSPRFACDLYPGWEGRSERAIGFQSGCCIMFRHDILRNLNSFDERFFFNFEESDLCHRIWRMGRPVLFCPDAEITHLGGQSVGRFPIRFALETYRSGYRFFYKHYGAKGVLRIRWVYLIRFVLRYCSYKLFSFIRNNEALTNRLSMYKVSIKWHWRVDPLRFIETGEEPDLGYQPLAPAPDMIHEIFSTATR